MAVRIISDSSADLSEYYAERIEQMPMTIRFGEDEYIDGVTITKKEFYEKMIEGDVLPCTSQPSPAAFGECYKRITEAGDSAVVVTVTSELSGTYQSACLAAADYDNIFVIDSRSASVGTGILAEYGVDCADRGMSAEEIAEHLTEKRESLCVVALVNTLEYLKKGGRISAAAAIAGGLLNLKPVITIKDGVIVVLGKARGSKAANNMLSEKVREKGVDFTKPVLLGYSGLSDALLNKYRDDNKELWQSDLYEIDSTLMSATIGVYAGPGAIAAGFFTK